MVGTIEEAACGDILPVNAKAMANRLIEIMDEHNTNNLEGDVGKEPRVHKLLWLLNQQVFGQLGKIDMSKEWECLCDSDYKDVEYCKRSFRTE